LGLSSQETINGHAERLAENIVLSDVDGTEDAHVTPAPSTKGNLSKDFSPKSFDVSGIPAKKPADPGPSLQVF
jgi:hypothetical protein